MKTTSRLWRWLGLIFVLSFGALGYLGWQIYLSAPPIPKQVVTTEGEVLYTAEQIQLGQQAWMSAGGQQLGTVWGHGAYVAPDWSADWLHREAVTLGQLRTAEQTQGGHALTDAERAAITQGVRDEMRRNTYDDSNGVVKVTAARAKAIREVAAHYDGLFGTDPKLEKLRDQYAMTAGALPEKEHRQALTAFFFWSAWAATTDRPGESGLSYTSNWPHEPLVGNTMSASAAMWSMVSVILLLAGIAAMLWLHKGNHGEEDAQVPKADPLLGAKATPSMKATRKYFFTVIGLMLLQIGMGAITAHYAVEGQSFFGLPLAQILPYTISRTVHTQIGVFWIATAWLATGLYVAPLLSGREPKLQKLGVDALFWALIIVVLGSTITGWLGTLQHRGVDFSFWFGNQGLEFTSMGRFWQILLFVGLLFWVFLLGRALWPALKKPSETRGLIAMVFLSATCIGGFYATSLTWGQHTHYSMIEYWRWWLVHLWVEGFFEVFATAVVALIGDHRLPVRRHPGHAAPPLLDRHAHFGDRRRLGVLCPGSRAPDADRPGSPADLAPLEERRLAGRLQVGHPVLRRRGLLEHRRCRPAGLRHQPAGLAVLRARPEHDGRPRPRRPVRCLRHAGHRPDAVLPARPV